ncbi:Uncharacterized protein MCHI_004004, partial [Candidatus Magnetoovum chiemensis]
MSNVYLLTLGCPKNQADSQKLINLLNSNGVQSTNNIEDAALILINTCGFIEDAKKE